MSIIFFEDIFHEHEDSDFDFFCALISCNTNERWSGVGLGSNFPLANKLCILSSQAALAGTIIFLFTRKPSEHGFFLTSHDGPCGSHKAHGSFGRLRWSPTLPHGSRAERRCQVLLLSWKQQNRSQSRNAARIEASK